MEKLIIEYYQSFETKEEKDSLSEKMTAACGRDFKKMDEFYNEYRNTHFAKVVKEYPETLFENMTSIEEVYKFIYQDVKTRLTVLKYPDSLNKLKSWVPPHSNKNTICIENSNKNKFHYLYEWISRKETDKLFEKLTNEQVKWITEVFPDKAD